MVSTYSVSSKVRCLYLTQRVNHQKASIRTFTYKRPSVSVRWSYPPDGYIFTHKITTLSARSR